jgi:hypothetical protein
MINGQLSGPLTKSGPGQLSRYSRSLQAGRIRWERNFPYCSDRPWAPPRQTLGPTQTNPGSHPDRPWVPPRPTLGPTQTDPGPHPDPCKIRTWSFPLIKRPGRDFNSLSPNLVPRLKKELSYTSTPNSAVW